MAAGKVRIRLKKSLIGRKPNQRKTIKALGLKRIGSIVEKDINSAVLGMIKVVDHMIEVEEIKK